jgi:CheY-like chemotaxis protein
VLIVDDNAINRIVCGALCEQFGVTFEYAEDGQLALDAVRRGGFDLVLMDIHMPNMDGVEATLAIQALPGPERAIPIIAVTTAADPESALRYRSLGMLDVVAKPIEAARLAEAITVALAAVEARTADAA